MLTFELAFYSSPKLRPATASLRRGSLSSDHSGGKRRGRAMSPRRERSVSALCSWGDGHHADHEFTLADLVLRPLPRTAKPSAVRSQRLCLRPPTVPLRHRWVAETGPSFPSFGTEEGRPQFDQESIAPLRARRCDLRATP
jgi:hypothetical protein